MKRKLIGLTLGFVLAGHMAFALTSDEVIADLQAQGFTRVEVKVGPTQIKVEAIRGTDKVETIYDSGSGMVLKTETGSVESGENTAPGVSVRTQSRDFVRVVVRGSADDPNAAGSNASGDDDDSDHHDGSDDDSNDDHDDSSSDDSDDDHGGSGGHGSDDSGSDDHDDDSGSGSDDD